MFVNYNANPVGNRVKDCTVRAISKATGKPWIETYLYLCIYGLLSYDMPDANRAWSSYLRSIGWKRHGLVNSCPDCYTVRDFCNDHRRGKYILALSGHVVAVENGNYFDTWDSGDEFPVYYWTKEE